LDEKDLRRAVALHARVRRLEETFKRWRRMPDYWECEEARGELRRLGVVVPPGDGWDGPPVAV